MYQLLNIENNKGVVVFTENQWFWWTVHIGYKASFAIVCFYHQKNIIRCWLESLTWHSPVFSAPHCVLLRSFPIVGNCRRFNLLFNLKYMCVSYRMCTRLVIIWFKVNIKNFLFFSFLFFPFFFLFFDTLLYFDNYITDIESIQHLRQLILRRSLKHILILA